MEVIDIVKDYIINRNTMAILPYYQNNKLFSKIIEEDRECIVEKKPLDIVINSCKYYGGSFDGKKEGTKTLIDITHKSPIAVEPHNMIYLFPTASANQPHCAWISYIFVANQYSAKNNQTTVVFLNQKKLKLDISLHSFKTQLYRTAHLCMSLQRRIIDWNLTMNFMLQPKLKEGIIFEDIIDFKRKRSEE